MSQLVISHVTKKQYAVYKINKMVYTATYLQCLVYIGCMSLTNGDHLKAWMTANNLKVSR